MTEVELTKEIDSNIKDVVIKRDIGIDIVKAVAIFFVVGVHFFLNTKFYKTNLNNSNLFIQTVIQQLFLVCIPLFVMSTGYLNNNTKINSSYFKKIIPIILIYILYSIPALTYRAHIGEVPYDMYEWITQVLDFKGHRYSWYINMYFGLFLLAPFLNRMYNSLDSKKEKQVLIAVLMLLTSATTFKFLHLPKYWSKIYPLTYYLIGKYIREYKPSINTFKNILLLMCAILLQAIYEYVAAEGLLYTHALTDYSSLLRLIEGYLLFILLYKIKINNNKISCLLVNISKLTLDIYLASFITDRLTYSYIKPYNIAQEQYIYLMIPLILISFVSAYVISRLRERFIKIR